jgi:hypothetical protein
MKTDARHDHFDHGCREGAMANVLDKNKAMRIAHGALQQFLASGRFEVSAPLSGSGGHHEAVHRWVFTFDYDLNARELELFWPPTCPGLPVTTRWIVSLHVSRNWM